MKTQSIPRFLLMLLLLAIVGYSFSQQSTEYAVVIASGKSKLHTPDTYSTEAKKNISTDIKAQHSFLKHFKNAEEVSWSKVDNDYLVSFKTGDIDTRALISKNGTLLYTIYYGSEKDLPKSIDEQVRRSTYYNYQITRTIQVNIDQHHVWVVYLKDNTNYIVLRIEEDEMQVMQQFHE